MFLKLKGFKWGASVHCHRKLHNLSNKDYHCHKSVSRRDEWKGPITSLTESSRGVQITFPTGHANSAGFDSWIRSGKGHTLWTPWYTSMDRLLGATSMQVRHVENYFSVNPQSDLPRPCFTVTASKNLWNLCCRFSTGTAVMTCLVLLKLIIFPGTETSCMCVFPFPHWAQQKSLTSLVQLYPTAARQPECYPQLDSSPGNRYLLGRWQWLWGRTERESSLPLQWPDKLHLVQGNCKIDSILGERPSLPSSWAMIQAKKHFPRLPFPPSLSRWTRHPITYQWLHWAQPRTCHSRSGGWRNSSQHQNSQQTPL